MRHLHSVLFFPWLRPWSFVNSSSTIISWGVLAWTRRSLNELLQVGSHNGFFTNPRFLYDMFKVASNVHGWFRKGNTTVIKSYLKIPWITICHFCKSLCSLSLCLIFNHCLVVSPCLAVCQVAGCLLVCVASEVHLPHVKPWVSRILPMNRWCAMAGVMIFGPGMSCFGIYIKT